MKILKLEFYVPDEYAEIVKKAVFDAGAGKVGNYDSCCWQAEGVGQFKPLKGSRPFIGNSGKLEKVKELKIELICKEIFLEKVIRALIEAHPYEEPAYQYWEVNKKY